VGCFSSSSGPDPLTTASASRLVARALLAPRPAANLDGLHALRSGRCDVLVEAGAEEQAFEGATSLRCRTAPHLQPSPSSVHRHERQTRFPTISAAGCPCRPQLERIEWPGHRPHRCVTRAMLNRSPPPGSRSCRHSVGRRLRPRGRRLLYARGIDADAFHAAGCCDRAVDGPSPRQMRSRPRRRCRTDGADRRASHSSPYQPRDIVVHYLLLHRVGEATRILVDLGAEFGHRQSGWR